MRHIQRINKWNFNQIGSYEVFTKSAELSDLENNVYDSIGPFLKVDSIQNKFYYIFEWLKLFDFNIVAIVLIMIFVSSINMIVVILILILERIKMIGILKSIGMNSLSVKKIFVFNSFNIIVRGMVLGNFIGLGIMCLQDKYKLLRLPSENYYVNYAPINFDFLHIFLINAFTLTICMLILVLPLKLISKFIPVKILRIK